jgi:branched-chain amino acid transport system permease protein
LVEVVQHRLQGHRGRPDAAVGAKTEIDAVGGAVLGGIGSLPGAMIGGVLIGLIRAMSDQYIETRWTNVVVFGVLILILVFRPSGLLGLKQREKV